MRADADLRPTVTTSKGRGEASGRAVSTATSASRTRCRRSGRPPFRAGTGDPGWPRYGAGREVQVYDVTSRVTPLRRAAAVDSLPG
ncbi:hypothetical protein, partial [uncultured Microbacterium sp.]|uniref:hypothetical protein n=1 Tax=uncultured Microbacterium sp. TaxID=191216 RepID=UPI0028F058F4